MERLDVTAVRALRVMLDGQPTTDAKIAFAWKIAAGPNLARAATVSWSSGTLAVRVRSEPWRAEIARARPVIAERLVQLLGPGVVKRITVEAVADAEPGRYRHTSG